MGLWGILTANWRSLKRQRDLQRALLHGEVAEAQQLIAHSIHEILRAGLTKGQLTVLEALYKGNSFGLSERLSAAFQKGWTRGGVPTLSNAMDEALRDAQDIVAGIGAFARLSEEDQEVIGKYGAVLEKLPTPLKPESKLPYPRERVRQALLHGLEQTQEGTTRAAFEGSLAALDDFIPDAEVPTDLEQNKKEWARRGRRANQVGDHAGGLAESRRLADQGDAAAQANLGFLYELGQGVPQDYAEAVRWYRRAADQGHAAAQANLGFLYILGQGLPQDDLLAYLWFNLAASQSVGERFERIAKVRDIEASKLTAEQRARAQQMTREWKPKPER